MAFRGGYQPQYLMYWCGCSSCMECKKWDLIGREGEERPWLNGWVKVPRPPLSPANSWLSACQSGSEFPFRHPAFVTVRKSTHALVWVWPCSCKKNPTRRERTMHTPRSCSFNTSSCGAGALLEESIEL